MKRIRALLLTLLYTSLAALWATNISITIDSAQVDIGTPFEVAVEITTQKSDVVLYANTNERIASHIEIVHSHTPVVKQIGADNQKITYIYSLLSFESGTYSFQVGPFIKNGTDTIWSPTVECVVRAEQIDLQAPIKDVLPPIEVHYTWYETHKTTIIILSILLLLILIGIVLWNLYKRGLLHKSIPTKLPEPKELFYNKALRLLDELPQKKYIEHNKYKLHYTELTDILRAYFEELLHIALFEKTTDEAMQEISKTGKISPTIIAQLHELFSQADLVKFAKYTPLLQHANLHYGIAKTCITETLPKEQTDDRIAQK